MKFFIYIFCISLLFGCSPKSQTENSTTTNNTNISSSSESGKESKPKNKSLSASELDEVLKTEPCYVESTEYVIQDEKLKSLYPDLLSAVVKNNSGTDIKNAKLAFAAWDENNFPIKISTQFGFEDSYVVEINYSDVNSLNGTTFGEKGGLALGLTNSKINKFKAIVVDYTDFDGNTWKNPHYQNWLEIYKDKKLTE